MKAKNKFQKEIVAYKLRPITPKQKAWAIEKTTPKYVVVSRNTTFCLECGHKWKQDIAILQKKKKCECPNCESKLKLCHDHTIDKVNRYFAIFATHKGHQIVRMFWLSKFLKKKQKYSYHISEVMQHWIKPDGRVETLSKLTNGYAQMYYDLWIFSSKLEPRMDSIQHHLRCNLEPWAIYPGRSVLPILKRNGFKGYTYDFVPHKLFALLLTENRAETLFKAGQIDLLRNFISAKVNIDKFWKSILICIRNNYKIKDAGTYFDYLHLLDYFGKDLHSSKYLCPENLNKEHDRLSDKKTLIVDHERNMRYQAQYEQQKAKFFDLMFRDENLVVEPLKSVEEFQKEAKSLGHCVYSSDYFTKEDSLVFSAKVNGERTETVEFSLSELEILQARGRGNKATKHNQRIVDLVQGNIQQITKAMSA